MEDVAKIPGLQLRGRIYYSRVIVPSALAARFGRRQIWKSLGTSERSQAVPLHFQNAASAAARDG
ncbi:DUF6538 domain-containing protein [Sphingomonas sp.]|uniref:DUF6538 domain-containing protein n=1 Tax=Sphingomonas sp. TaxID=28214 RepID=UPI003753B7D2